MYATIHDPVTTSTFLSFYRSFKENGVKKYRIVTGVKQKNHGNTDPRAN